MEVAKLTDVTRIYKIGEVETRALNFACNVAHVEALAPPERICNIRRANFLR